MPEEQEGELGEAYAWKQLLRLDPLLGLTLFLFSGCLFGLDSPPFL